MRYIKVVCLVFLFPMLLHAGGRMTPGQSRFDELCRAAEVQLAENGECTQEFLERQVTPLLMESISRGEIWDDTLLHPTIPAFNSFLIPEIGKQPNPFFRYAMAIFFASDRFQGSELAFRQESCFRVVRMLCKEEYVEFHPFITRMLFQYFHGPEYYGENTQRWLLEMLARRDLRDNPKVVLLLLFQSPQFYDHWLLQISDQLPAIFDAVDSGNPLPRIILVLSARNASRESMELLTDVLSRIDDSPEEVKR